MLIYYKLLFSWLCCYMAQMNPLIGPKLSQHTLLMIAKEWVKKKRKLYLNFLSSIKLQFKKCNSFFFRTMLRYNNYKMIIVNKL